VERPSETWDEAIRRLRAHHLPTLDPETRRVVVLRALGRSQAEIAKDRSKSVSGVRRDLERVEDAVCLPLGVRRDGWMMGLWVGMHLGCCLAPRAVAAFDIGVS